MIDLAARLTIERLGQRGEGIASGTQGSIFVPYTLPGDTIIAEVDGTRGRLVEVLTPGPERVAAICPYFGTCGGCAVQTLAASAYVAWKRGLLAEALRHAKISTEVGELVDAHGNGRRRASFHARYDGRGEVKVGFMRARAHDVVDLQSCPVLAPAMAGAIAAARALALELAAARKPLDITELRP